MDITFSWSYYLINVSKLRLFVTNNKQINIYNISKFPYNPANSKKKRKKNDLAVSMIYLRRKFVRFTK